jgi:hypothetical protein
MILNKGDIGFIIHKKNILSKTIAWFMKSRWSHSFLVMGQWEHKTMLLETSDFEVVISTIDPYLNNPKVDVEIYRSKTIGYNDSFKIRDEGFKIVKTIYGYPQLISLGIRRLLMRIGIKIPNFFRFGMVCCAVPIYGHRVAKSSELYGLDPESIDTEELYQKCKEKMELVYSSDHQK